MNISMIGTGNLGKALGRSIVNKQLGQISGVYNRTEDHSKQGVAWIGAGTICPTIESLPASDIYFITTPDDAIEGSCLRLSKNQHILPGAVVAHCSGALSSEILQPMKALGCVVASVHPMLSFTQHEHPTALFENAFCAVEGDPDAVTTLSSLFTSLGSHIYAIRPDQKARYHVAGVFASNYLVTLSQQALSCLQAAGVEDELAMKIIISLMKSSLLNLEKTLSPKQSLTGPIQRGDIATIQRHLQAITDPKQQDLYIQLGEHTLDLIEGQS